jgi:hypothetical protein
VFLEIDGIIQRYDDDGVGNWFAPDDPDYSVTGKTLQIYTWQRFESNPPIDPPKVVIWYTTVVGSTETVTGIIAGKNIQLSGCGVSSGAGTGNVVVTGKPDYQIVPDSALTTAVKKLEVNPITECIDVHTGPVVTKIIPGSRVSIAGVEDGTGEVIVSALPSLNSTELLVPESIWLESAKNDLLFDRFDCAILEPSGRQSFIAKFKMPSGLVENYIPNLVLDYIVSLGVPTETLTLLIDPFQLELNSNLANAASSSFTSSFSVDIGNAAKLVRQEIPLTGISLKKDSVVTIEVSRDSSDAYTGDFNILNARLRFKPDLV